MLNYYYGVLESSNYKEFFGEKSDDDYNVRDRLERLVNVRRFIAQYVDEDKLAQASKVKDENGQKDGINYGTLLNEWVSLASQYPKDKAIDKFCVYLKSADLYKNGSNATLEKNGDEIISSFELDMEIIDCNEASFNKLGDTVFMRSKKKAHFTVDSYGDYKLVIPPLTGTVDGNYSIESCDEITITGKLTAEDPFEILSTLLFERNGFSERSGDAKYSRRLVCFEPQFPSTYTRSESHDEWGDGKKIRHYTETFTHTNPNASSRDDESSHLYLDVAKDGAICIDAVFEGEGYIVMTDSDPKDSYEDNYSETLKFKLTGRIDASDAEAIWEYTDKILEEMQ